MTPEERESAEKLYKENLERLEEMDYSQKRYIKNLAVLDDPLTDDLECDHEEMWETSAERADFLQWERELGALSLAPLRDPFSEWHGFSGKSTTPLTHDIICLHTMVGTLAGSWSWAAGAGRAYWHYGINGQGVIWQCHDLRYRSAANLNGNWRVIPIETSDMKEGVFASEWNDPLWTAKQMDAIVKLVAWLCIAFNIPPVLIPDTKPGRRGIAYHRQGIVPNLVPGGEKWSNATGKSCPARRVAQIEGIIARVRDIVIGKPKEWDEMASKQELKEAFNEALDSRWSTPGSAPRLAVDEILKKNDNLGGLVDRVAKMMGPKIGYRVVPDEWDSMSAEERKAYGVHWVVLNMYKLRIPEGSPLDNNAKVAHGSAMAERIPKEILDAMPTLAVVS